MRDEIRGYGLQIAGTKQDAERAADEWGVRIRVVGEYPDRNEVYAACPVDDRPEIWAWHDDAIERLRAGKSRPGDLMRIEQPPLDVNCDFTGEEKKKPKRSPPGGGGHGPLVIDRSKIGKFDEL